MQSFWAIIHFAFFLSDWFIAHSNVLKGLNTLYEQLWLQSNLENPGLWGLCYSAWDWWMLFVNCCTSQQPELQKLVSKCQKIPTEHGAEYASPVQSCRMSIFSHPVQISQYGTILHLQWDSWQQITRIMVNCKKKTTKKPPKTNKQKKNRERCQGFDKCLLSVLSQFKESYYQIQFKKRQNISIPVDIS